MWAPNTVVSAVSCYAGKDFSYHPGVAATHALIVRYSDGLTLQYNYSRLGEDVCIVLSPVCVRYIHTTIRNAIKGSHTIGGYRPKEDSKLLSK